MDHLSRERSEKLVTSPDYGTADEVNPNDPDPAAPGPGLSADSPGVPVGSAESVGGSDFVDGAEIGGEMEEDDQSSGNPITPASAFNETNTEG